MYLPWGEGAGTDPTVNHHMKNKLAIFSSLVSNLKIACDSAWADVLHRLGRTLLGWRGITTNGHGVEFPWKLGADIALFAASLCTLSGKFFSLH